LAIASIRNPPVPQQASRTSGAHEIHDGSWGKELAKLFPAHRSAQKCLEQATIEVFINLD
jgi:hypothetical protein